jgi:D-alanine--poly(phosphoribitol) ligase subunit 2
MERHSEQLISEIGALIRDKLLVKVDSPEDDLLSSGVLDSLTLVQLLVDLEQRFGVTIPLEELEIDDFRSVSAIARMVQSRTALSSAVEEKQARGRPAVPVPAAAGGNPGRL